MGLLPGRSNIGVVIAGDNRYPLRRTQPPQPEGGLTEFIGQPQIGQITGYGHMVGGRLRKVAQQCLNDMRAVNATAMMVPGQVPEQTFVEQSGKTDPGQ